jgi:hypothetical protein
MVWCCYDERPVQDQHSPRHTAVIVQYGRCRPPPPAWSHAAVYCDSGTLLPQLAEVGDLPPHAAHTAPLTHPTPPYLCSGLPNW